MNHTSQAQVLGYEEAAAVMRREADGVRTAAGRERVPLREAAGRVLAKAIAADRDQPPLPRSTRDGYACPATDLARGPLRVIGQLRAGESWTGGELAPGEAVEIMTGAPVPAGADCVVMVEHVVLEAGHISMTGPRELAAGDNIVPAGAEAHRGDVVIAAGQRMGAAAIAAAGACGAAEVTVFRRPRVAILATGDELVEVAATPLAHQIRNSNCSSLAVQVRSAGGEPVVFSIVRDERAATEAAIRVAAVCDLLVLTGGVSMGKFDFVEDALQGLEAEFFFTGARIQPGKPVVFGRLPAQYFLGLPGNPISTMVTFALFGAPLLRALGGESEGEPRFSLARVEEEVHVKPGLTRFLPARLRSDVESSWVRRIPWQGSGDLAAAAQADGFLVVPETAERLAAGEIASVLEL
ncbi:MAG TPA: molybdopterin molybdotransferase MoeA [Acidobacteriaceae bacterium]|jgi:molybdopterin molybdotransferase|nr:molybdopterin molybdotransferase MoeA [Acidobacteriaceae bacterium]